jgi:putative Mg2+ transporter-C (MgtC) family protein
MLESITDSHNIGFLARLGLAFVCGLMIGIERELKNKPAGISTQTLVITGAMMFAFVDSVINSNDTTRIAAQVVSGIGFLGAGIILKSEDKGKIDNVTTAASIWYAAAIGLALGFGYYFIAVVAAAYAVIISRIPNLPWTHGDGKKDI